MSELEEKTHSKPVFSEGASVVYGLHGRCQIVAIEKKKVGNQLIEFYKLEKVNNAIVKPKKSHSFILLPVDAAVKNGLRHLISEEDSQKIWDILGSREYYFPVDENWKLLQKKVEATILSEGAFGLAKAASYLFTLISRMVVPPSDLLKFQETVNKQLARELAELTEDPIRVTEEKMEAALKNKLKPDS